jgi:hypothetical protein
VKVPVAVRVLDGGLPGWGYALNWNCFTIQNPDLVAHDAEQKMGEPKHSKSVQDERGGGERG